MKASKRIRKARELVTKDAQHSLDQALEIIAKYSAEAKAKFDESVEVTMKLGVDPKQTDQMVRGAVAMPNGLGKSVRVAVFSKAERVKEAEKAGADVCGSEELIETVKAGKIDFDVCIATPDMMVQLSKLGKVLGPKGLMPNPKLGTVTEDIEGAVKRAKAGQVEYKTEKAGIVQAAVGKVSFSVKDLKENIIALYSAVLAAKPSASKGTYMKDFYLSTSMGPSIRVDLGKIVG
ncbi:MAG: rplA [Candidatus Midichloriaceae bacterium]|jgi:large subunit ribosomal protein L1|nr:rplA [Candidatus Midichloriaceae bacterium]